MPAEKDPSESRPANAVGSGDLLAAVALLRENREACAACFRVIAATDDPTITERLDRELKQAGVKNGFGVRTQDFIAAAANVPDQRPGEQPKTL